MEAELADDSQAKLRGVNVVVTSFALLDGDILHFSSPSFRL